MQTNPDFILADIKREMSAAGVHDPAGDIEVLYSYMQKTSGPPDGAAWQERFHDLLKRRIAREPLERIIGYADFLEAAYSLTPSVYRPAAETETTVEHALIAAEAMNRKLRILDLGTGTGCMLIALLRKLPDATGVGVDITADSLSLAQQNAERHDVADRAAFLHSDWTDGVEGLFDIIISNPPRIPSAMISALVKEVSAHDPLVALDGGADGLLFYERLARDFRRIAVPDAQAFIQVGNITAPQVAGLFARHGYGGVRIKTDYKYAPNCVAFTNKPQKRQGIWGRWLSKGRAQRR